MAENNNCKVESCDGIGKKNSRNGRRYFVKGYCLKHYTRITTGRTLEDSGLHHIKDGKSKHQLYRVWCNMRQRCNDEASTSYKNYGAKGIKVCDRWQGKYGFNNFLSDVGERPEGTSLDRIRSYGNYEPNNVRWATPKEQSLNRTNNNLITFDSMTKTLSEWAEHLGIKRSTLTQRFYSYKWSVEKCLTSPVRKRGY